MTRVLILTLITGLSILIAASSTPPSLLPDELFYCVDFDCKDFISRGKTLLKYTGRTNNHLSFKQNEDIRILSKPLDDNSPDWVGMVRRKVGLVPKSMLREDQMRKHDNAYRFPLNVLPAWKLVEEVEEKEIPPPVHVETGDDDGESGEESKDGPEGEDFSEEPDAIEVLENETITEVPGIKSEAVVLEGRQVVEEIEKQVLEGNMVVEEKEVPLKIPILEEPESYLHNENDSDHGHHHEKNKEYNSSDSSSFIDAVVPEGRHVVEEKQVPEGTQVVEEKQVPEGSQVVEEKQVPEGSQIVEEKLVPEGSQVVEEKQVLEGGHDGKEKQVPEESQVVEEKEVPLKIPILEEPESYLHNENDSDHGHHHEKRVVEEKQVPEENQVVEEKQVPEGNQVVEEKQVLEGNQVVEEKQVPEGSQVVEEKQVPEGSQVVEEKQVPEGSQVVEEKQVPEGSQVVEEKQVPEGSQVVEEKQVPEGSQVVEEKQVPGGSQVVEEKQVLEENLVVEEKQVLEENLVVEEKEVPVKIPTPEELESYLHNENGHDHGHIHEEDKKNNSSDSSSFIDVMDLEGRQVVEEKQVLEENMVVEEKEVPLKIPILEEPESYLHNQNDHDHGHLHEHYHEEKKEYNSSESSSFIVIVKHLSSTLLSFLPEHLQDTIIDVDDALVFTGIIALTLVSICVPYYFIEGFMSGRLLKKKIVDLNKSLWKVSTAYENQQEEFEVYKKKALAYDEDKKRVETLEYELVLLKKLEAKQKEQVISLKKELKANAQVAEEVQSLVETTMDRKNKALEEKDKLKTAVTNLKEALRRTTDELQEAQAEGSSIVMDLELARQSNETLSMKVGVLEKEVMELKSKLVSEVDRRRTSEDEQNELSKSNVTIENELTELKKICLKYEETVNNLSTEISCKENELAVLKETLGDDSPLVDIAEVKAKLVNVEEENISVHARIEAVTLENRSLSRNLQEATGSVSTIQQERDEALNRLQVLEAWFKEKEEELKKAVDKYEAEKNIRGKDKDDLVRMIEETGEENKQLTLRVESIKEEFEEVKLQHRNELRATEAKTHENWLALCQAERKAQDARKESEFLRQRLTALTKEKEGAGDNEDVNGEVPMYPFITPDMVPPPLDDNPSYFGLGDGFMPPPPLPLDEEREPRLGMNCGPSSRNSTFLSNEFLR